ncbi:hypothetical protein [Arthrobacter sp. Leaf69]|uniref:hypothetical protein n=1 Tax=Arthrobacter sp. Leaf69 TaxID=1736232 RepID=UPI000B27FEFC|nr:hypothetical protein [Arthrobacter sp. Leaf69]
MKQRALLPAVLLLVLAGCSSGGSGPAGPSESRTAATPAASAPQTSASPAPGTSEPADVSTSLNAPDALQQHVCTATADGSWSFKGTLVNNSDKNKVFSVAIGVTAGPAVAGHTLITKTVPAGQSADIAAANFAKTKDSNGTCTPVVSVEDAP